MSETVQPKLIDPNELMRDGISRRRFLALVGASAALASGVAGCSKVDRGPVVPYTRKPREVLPGVATHYASTFQEGLAAYSVLVTTREGRPILVEGNEEHPELRGKTSVRASADILRLYDPDRLQYPLVQGQRASWEEAETRLRAALTGARVTNKRVALLTGAVLSPTRWALIADLRRVLPGLVHIPFEPAGAQGERLAAIAAFGDGWRPRYHLDRADVVVSLQSDFLGSDPNAPIAMREFCARRRPRGPQDRINRLWTFEAGMTLTGAKADQRVAVRPSRAAAVPFALARSLTERHGVALPQGLSAEVLVPFDLGQLAAELGVPPTLLDGLAAELARAGSAAVVVAGPTAPVEVHMGAHLLNAMLGTEGHTVENAALRPVDLCTYSELGTHLADMQAGKYHSIICWDVNPAYFYPDAKLWAAAAAAVPHSTFIGLHRNETARGCQVALPEHHWLEAWGDYETSAEIICLQQPTVGALYDTRQGEDVLLHMIGALGGQRPTDYHAYLKARWQKEEFPADSPVPFERFWAAALHDGVLVRATPPRVRRNFRVAAIAQAAAQAAVPSGDGFELALQPAPGVYDGRYGNNGWLQELPDPVTKVTWSNPVAIAIADARALHLKDGDVVRLQAAGRSVEVPVVVQPGQKRGVLSAMLGYGRSALSVAGGVGANVYPLLDETATTIGHRGGVVLTPTGRRVALPMTQGHHTMRGRDLVRTVSSSAYAEGHGVEAAKPEPPTLYPPLPIQNHKWEMVIDLSACVGCGGCVIACQAENNIPVVGPEQVLNGREMHWMRVDCYYEGDPEAPRVLHQPMLCQQCDNAPCENVCPVNATNHSPEGLSQMAYNRCVGTRYCANNCPFKVRRFNFLDFTGTKTASERLVFNPEVTVRPRGVMEKCTFCVQRIEDGKLRAKAEGRAIRDADVRPACASACAAEAIVFGDVKDPESAVSKLLRNTRGYHVLAELGVRPSVTYLANVTNAPGDGGTHAV